MIHRTARTAITRISRHLVLLLSAAIILPVTVHATASDPTIPNPPKTLSAIKNTSNQRITDRQVRVQKLTDKVALMQTTSPENRQQLQTEINNTKTGLSNLQRTINTDTTVSAATADYYKIYNNYRVRLLLSPKVDLVKAADDQLAVEAFLEGFAQGIVPYINDSPNAASLQQMLDDMNAKLANTKQVATSVQTTVLPLTPADYNANHMIMTDQYAKLRTNLNDLKAAYSEFQSIYTILVNE